MQKNQNMAPIGRPPVPSSNFIKDSKSIKDEVYLGERRKELGDQVFNELMQNSRP